MSKKRPKASREKPIVAEVVVARILVEQAWAYEQRIVHGLPWPTIRALALRPDEHGGIGRNVSVGMLRNMVAAHRAEQGEVNGTREERIERRQIELDTLALAARASLARAGEAGALDVHAAKVLLDVRAAEAKMHGDDAALRIEADVTTHDAVDAALDEMLARMPGRASAKS